MFQREITMCISLNLNGSEIHGIYLFELQRFSGTVTVGETDPRTPMGIGGPNPFRFGEGGG